MRAECCGSYYVLEESEPFVAGLVAAQEKRVLGTLHQSRLSFAQSADGSNGLGLGAVLAVFHVNISTVPEN